MSIYLMMIFMTVIFSMLAMQCSTIGKNNPNKRKPGKIFVFIIIIVWCTIYAFRYRVGTDFGTYYRFFNRIVTDNLTLAETIQEQRDALFGYIAYFSAKVFEGEWLGFAYLCAVLIYTPIMIVIYKKSDDFLSSSLLYIFTMTYFSGFNGVRQAIAIAFLSLAYYCGLKEKRYWIYLIFVLLAFGFHSTVFIIVPFQLLSLKSVTSKSFKISIIVLLFSYLFLWNIWSVIIGFLETIGQSKLASDYAELAENGSSLLRLIVSTLPPFLGLIYRKKLIKKYPDIDSDIIMITISSIFLLFSLKNWIFARISGYFNVVLIMFLPKLNYIFAENSRQIGRLLILGLYFCYMILLLLHGGGHLLPYRFIEF